MPSTDPPAVKSCTADLPRSGAQQAAAAISTNIDTRTAAIDVAERLHEHMGDECHLLLTFASFHHRAAFPEAVGHLRQIISPRVMIGVTTESVIGVDQEREGRAGLAAIALRMDGVRLHPWWITPENRLDHEDSSIVQSRLGTQDDTRAILMLADPFSTPMPQLLPQIAEAGAKTRNTTKSGTIPVIGGMASGASQPGHNLLAVDDTITSAGAVGVTISGDIDINCLVSQGCRPIGQPMVVTKVKDNVIVELGGRKPMEVLKETTLELGEHDRDLMKRGLLIGVVIDEYKGRFGRGDFLIRAVAALDLKNGFIAVAERLRVGQTIQFHVRDSSTATEDLQLLMDGQQVQDAPPFASLLFTCNGRGTRLFDEPDHDLNVITSRLGNIPVAGFSAAGEIGPIGNQSFVHGHTASIAVFRPRTSSR